MPSEYVHWRVTLSFWIIIYQAIDILTSAAEAATTKTIDAFQILMAGGRTKVDQQPPEYH
jgi:hypothetical protein